MLCRLAGPQLAVAILLSAHLHADDLVLDAGGFEMGIAGEVPAGWQVFPRTAKPSVKLVDRGANGSPQSLRGERSASGGLTALAREFAPQKRVMIEFSFAFAKTNGRSLNVWTHEPHGKDASQLNLSIQNGVLMQFDGRTRTWEEVTRQVEPTIDPARPVWHRLRAIVDSKRPGIDYWISEPNGREFPDSPITRQAYRTDLAVGAIALVSGQRIAPHAWYLIDDLQVTGGEDLPPAPPSEAATGRACLVDGAAHSSRFKPGPICARDAASDDPSSDRRRI